MTRPILAVARPLLAVARPLLAVAMAAACLGAVPSIQGAEATSTGASDKVEVRVYHAFGTGKKTAGEAVKNLPSSLKAFARDFKRMPFSKIVAAGSAAVRFSGEKPFQSKVPKGLGDLRIQREPSGSLRVTIYTKDKKKHVFRTSKTVIYAPPLSDPKAGKYLLLISVTKKPKK